uniref:Uncharacterized protein n=1 Tax=Oryza meridionalis TaxID=40149 RepID=A0A0E0EG81_9ORYZ
MPYVPLPSSTRSKTGHRKQYFIISGSKEERPTAQRQTQSGREREGSGVERRWRNASRYKAQNYSINAQAQPEVEQKGVHGGGGGGVAGAQVEAALNRKNVEALPEDEMVEGGPKDAWVPDHETGIFVPTDEAAVSGTENHDHCGAAATAGGSPSVLD